MSILIGERLLENHVLLEQFVLMLCRRDLKPGNVLLVTDEENPDWTNINIWQITIKLGDFGLARENENGEMSITMSKPCGTLSYMAPEMVQVMAGKEDKVRSNWSLDIFSAGVIAYQLQTGTIKDSENINYWFKI